MTKPIKVLFVLFNCIKIKAALFIHLTVKQPKNFGEARRAIDTVAAEQRVALRLVFDDPAHPDFTLDLWLPADAGRGDELPPGEAAEEANRWLARIEALLRRPITTPRRIATTPPPAPSLSPQAFRRDAAVEDGCAFSDEDEDDADEHDDRRNRAII